MFADLKLQGVSSNSRRCSTTAHYLSYLSSWWIKSNYNKCLLCWFWHIALLCRGIRSHTVAAERHVVAGRETKARQKADRAEWSRMELNQGGKVRIKSLWAPLHAFKTPFRECHWNKWNSGEVSFKCCIPFISLIKPRSLFIRTPFWSLRATLPTEINTLDGEEKNTALANLEISALGCDSCSDSMCFGVQVQVRQSCRH